MKEPHLGKMFSAYLSEKRKEQLAKQEQEKKLEEDIIKAMQEKDFAKAIYLDNKIKEMESNEQKDN